MKKISGRLFHYTLLLLLLSVATILCADDGDVLNRSIRISKNKGTVYQLLQQVSDISGYLFIYDSQVVNNDKEVKIAKREYTLREIIYAITRNERLNIKVVGNHILLHLPEKPVARIPDKSKPEQYTFFTISGNLKDRITNEPIPYAAASVGGTTIGTIANQEGDFKLILADSLKDSEIVLSQIGYQSQHFKASLLEGQHIDFYLDPRVIPLQEVVVRAIDPLDVLGKMQLNKEHNYARKPTYMTSFYREGIDFKKKNIDITEAVLNLYKQGVDDDPIRDQAKLLKMRRLRDNQEVDSFLPKMKSGINACLMLDIIKGDMTDFLSPKEKDGYSYSHVDITTIGDRRVNVIAFEPKSGVDYLYQGRLYIDAENYALLQATFEIYPPYVEKATSIFVVRKDPQFTITAQRIAYTVSYKELDGAYYVSHIRGDLDFKVKKKRRLFSWPLHMWFEMVNCESTTVDVKPFKRNERISTDNIFAETKFSYDEDFWGSFNTIVPEDELRESVIKILKKKK